jgi:hypothetical protein
VYEFAVVMRFLMGMSLRFVKSFFDEDEFAICYEFLDVYEFAVCYEFLDEYEFVVCYEFLVWYEFLA